MGSLNDGDATRSASDFPAAPADALAFSPGMELGPVRLSSELGRGAMGVVFLARHTLLHRPVAVKFLARQQAGSSDTMPSRFVDEAKAAAAVRHPNLTQIYHADIADGTPYLVLEYVEGPTLGRLLAHARQLSVDLAVHLMIQVSDAVGKLHEHDLIHRDLKPSNVLIDREGKALVTDFGLAMRRHAMDGSGRLAGTPAYMAPEMFEGRVSPRSDIYALGITLFSLVAGKVPFDGTLEELRQHHENTPLPLAGLNLPEELVDILERACHKQFMFRYKTAQELRRALLALNTDGARAKRELEAHLLNLRDGAGETAVPGSTTLPAADPPSSTTYAQTIARAAAAKRDRMKGVAGENDSPGALFKPAPHAAPLPDIAIPMAMALAYSATPLPVSRRPALLTVVAIIGIVIGSLGSIMLLVSLVDWVVNQHESTPLPIWYRPFTLAENVIGIVLCAALLTGAIAALRLRPWCRPLLLTYAVGEIITQIAGVIVHTRFTTAMVAREMTTQAISPATDAVFQNTMIGCIISIGAVVCAYAVTLLITLFNRRVRQALAPDSTQPAP